MNCLNNTERLAQAAIRLIEQDRPIPVDLHTELLANGIDVDGLTACVPMTWRTNT